MSGTLSLSAVAVGQRAVVVSYPKAAPGFLRFREMGLLPGTTVSLVRVAPLGDPLEIQVRGSRLTLRRSEADQIEVRSVPT